MTPSLQQAIKLLQLSKLELQEVLNQELLENPLLEESAEEAKQEDAEALVDALKKKQYAAFAANTPGDKLFHVQVGPFSEIKDAESARGKLVSDGYNPILKK